MRNAGFVKSREKAVSCENRTFRIYKGDRSGDDVVVTVDGEVLNPRRDLRAHSLDFDCGRPGCGAMQLALAILADHLGDDDFALCVYKHFAFAVVANLPYKEWTLNSQEIETALKAMSA